MSGRGRGPGGKGPGVDLRARSEEEALFLLKRLIFHWHHVVPTAKFVNLAVLELKRGRCSRMAGNLLAGVEDPSRDDAYIAIDGKEDEEVGDESLSSALYMVTNAT